MNAVVKRLFDVSVEEIWASWMLAARDVSLGCYFEVGIKSTGIRLGNLATLTMSLDNEPKSMCLLAEAKLGNACRRAWN